MKIAANIFTTIFGVLLVVTILNNDTSYAVSNTTNLNNRNVLLKKSDLRTKNNSNLSLKVPINFQSSSPKLSKAWELPGLFSKPTPNQPGISQKDKTINPMHEPSIPPFNVLGWYFKAGFALQPRQIYHVHIGDTFKIRTIIAKNSLSFIDTRYQWYQSGDNQIWTPIHGANQTDYTSTAQSVGSMNYQLTAQVWPMMFNSLIYSKMATVYFEPDPIPATGISNTTTDSHNLYIDDEFNNQSTLVKAHALPDNSTSEVTYESLNPDIATVNPFSGEVFPNKIKKSGKATIQAKVSNSGSKTPTENNNEYHSSVIINVGHMLTGPEQTYSGDYAKYTLNGDFDKSKYKIEWHGINGIVPQSELGNDLKNYVIKKTKIEDDGKEIYATISEINPKPQYDHLHNLIPPHEIVTNHVTLHVNKSAPLLSTDHFIREKPKSDGVNELTYHGSKHLWHELHVINSTSNEYEPENGWTGKLYYYLSKNEKVENVYNIDGFTKTKLDFDSLTFDKAKITLQINNLKLSKKELLQIQIQTRVINTDQPTFNYSPELIIPTPGNSESNFTQRFQENRVIFSNGNLKISPSEIHFGKINLIEPTMIAPDEHNSSNFADIKDTRVNKSAVNISIKADPKFYDKFETYFVQSFQLILLENMPIDLSENYTVISSKDGDQINSIPWSRFEHLRLFITDGNIPTNTYHTTITWTYGNAPL